MQQHQVVATAVEAIGRQVHLFRRGQMDELAATRGVQVEAAGLAGPRPLLGSAQMHQDGGGEGHNPTP